MIMAFPVRRVFHITDHFADVTKYLSDIDPCRKREKT